MLCHQQNGKVRIGTDIHKCIRRVTFQKHVSCVLKGILGPAVETPDVHLDARLSQDVWPKEKGTISYLLYTCKSRKLTEDEELSSKLYMLMTVSLLPLLQI